MLPLQGVRHAPNGPRAFELPNTHRHTALWHGRKVDSLLSIVQRNEFKLLPKTKAGSILFESTVSWGIAGGGSGERLFLNDFLRARVTLDVPKSSAMLYVPPENFI